MTKLTSVRLKLRDDNERIIAIGVVGVTSAVWLAEAYPKRPGYYVDP